ncbi:MAG: hypothetical protein EA401_14125, partial [Planctomycetota bacterium]
MAIPRASICGPPHTYFVHVQTALGLPRLGHPQASEILLDVLEVVRGVFDAGIYAWSIREDCWSWIVRHRADMPEDESRLRQRWARLGSRSIPRAPALQERLTSLSGLMQTVLGHASRGLSKSCGGPGTWWAPRFRCCLLADDCAVLAAVHGLEHGALNNQGSILH